jgi:hypothetical protein
MYRLAASSFEELARRYLDCDAKHQKQNRNISKTSQKQKENRVIEVEDIVFLSRSPKQDEQDSTRRGGLSPRPLAPFEEEDEARECLYDAEHRTV